MRFAKDKNFWRSKTTNTGCFKFILLPIFQHLSMILPRFFYDNGAGAGGGNVDAPPVVDAPPAKDTPPVADAPPPVVDVKPEAPKPIFTPEELKELGVENEVDAKKLLLTLSQKEKERNVPDAEKVKQQNLEKADFLRYAAKDGIFSVDEYNQMESLKSTNDRDLVFGEFFKSFKEENPNLSGDALAQAAKEEFETEYKLDSTNDKTKARGLSKIQREAAELRGPITKKYEEAHRSFSEEKEIAAKFPAFNKFIDEVITEATPDKLVLFKTKDGEDEIAVDVELTKEQREQITKMFRNAKTFSDYAADGVKADELKAKIKTKIEGFIKINNFDKVAQDAYTKGKGIGVKQGSTTGADNLFGAKDKTRQPAKVVTIDESNKKVAEARQRYVEGR